MSMLDGMLLPLVLMIVQKRSGESRYVLRQERHYRMVPNVQPLKNDRYRIPKSRYDSVDLYISNDERNLPEYHDIDVPMDQGVRERLVQHGKSPQTFQVPD
jgi:hypothetical protein